MATFFGKLLGGLGIGKNANPPSFGAGVAPVGIIKPAQMVGVTQSNPDIGVTTPKISIDSLIGVIDSGIGVAKNITNLVTPSIQPTINGGTLPEVVITDTPIKNAVTTIKEASNNLSQGKPLVTMGQEFAIADNLKLPLYIGLGLLAYKIFTGRGR